MEISQAISEVRSAMETTHHGFRWHKSDEYRSLLNQDPTEALPEVEASLLEMQTKRSLDDAGYFALANEVDEKVLFYNLVLAATQRKKQVPLTPMDIQLFRTKVADCALMDYGAYVEDLTKIICEGEVLLPERYRTDR